MSEMMNFAPRPGVAWSDQFEAALDAAMETEHQKQAPRRYIGASRLGEECERMLGYEFHLTPKDPDKHFKGKIIRVFDRGHDTEERMIAYLRTMGLTLVTAKPDGRQIGFGIAWSEERGCYAISGHCDGVITAVPPEMTYQLGLSAPALWECKALSNKSWSDTKRKGVKVSKPLYYVQMQLYMAYLELAEHPGLFTALNGDTGEVYAELVPFDRQAAQAASDRGARVVQSRSPEELPRISNDPTNFRCKWCSYLETCHRAAQPAQAPAQPWSWGANNAG